MRTRRRWLAVAAVTAATALLWSAAPATAQTTAPDRPTGLGADDVAHNSVRLSWHDPADTTITHHQILRRDRDTDPPGHFATINADTASATTSYTDTSAAPSKRYVYRVIAVNAAGNSPRSSYVTVDTPAAPPDAQPPARPTGLVAGDVAHNSVSLAWDDPDETTITHYQILRRDRDRDAPGHFHTINTNTGAATTTYTDTSAQADKRYVYRIIAVNAAGNSPRSSYVNVDTPTEPETTPDPDETTPEPEITEIIVTEPPPDESPIAAQQTIETETIWSTTMTNGGVEERSSSELTTQVGYRTLGAPLGNFGSLAGTTFDYEGDTYTVHEIRQQGTGRFLAGGLGVLANNVITLSFHFTVDDHGDDLSDLTLYIGSVPAPLADAATRVENVGGRDVRHFDLSLDLVLTEAGTSAVRLDRLDRDSRGPDGHPLSGRLTVGDTWIEQTYPTACRRSLTSDPGTPESIYHGNVRDQGPTWFPCVFDVASQWFMVRLEDDRRYAVEVDTEPNNLQPRLHHLAPTWATSQRMTFGRLADSLRVLFRGCRDGHGESAPCSAYFGVGGMLGVETFAGAGIWRGGDYFVRVTGYNGGISDPDYRIRVRQLD